MQKESPRRLVSLAILFTFFGQRTVYSRIDHPHLAVRLGAPLAGVHEDAIPEFVGLYVAKVYSGC